MNILIIDDDNELCSVLKNVFEKKGCNVYVTGLLSEGFYLIDKYEPGVVFIDNVLPDGEGWSAAKTINKKYPKIRINLISGMDQSQQLLENIDNTVWEKPITEAQIENYFSFLKF